MKKTIDTICPHCGTAYEISKEERGESATCESCGKNFTLGLYRPSSCPRCDEPHTVLQDMIGSLVVCNRCRMHFVAQSPKGMFAKVSSHIVASLLIIGVGVLIGVTALKVHNYWASIIYFSSATFGVIAFIVGLTVAPNLAGGNYSVAKAMSRRASRLCFIGALFVAIPMLLNVLMLILVVACHNYS